MGGDGSRRALLVHRIAPRGLEDPSATIDRTPGVIPEVRQGNNRSPAEVRESDDVDMGSTRTDRKLERLITLGACSAHNALALGRHADLVTLPGGTSVRTEGHYEPWSYYVLAGTALLSAGDEAVAVVGSGAWLLGHVPGQHGGVSPVSVLAGTDLELLSMRPRDLDAAVADIPGLLPR